jgi:hypothetical protein
MPAKPLRAIVCEGKDDVAVFRALLYAEGGKRKHSAGPRVERVERFETDRYEITIEERSGKSRLAELVLDVAEGSAGTRPDMVLVSFDPDLDPAHRELAFFERDFDEHGKRRAGPLTPAGAGRFSFRIGRRDVTLLPAPWRSSAMAGFAGLPEEHCIERILIEGIVASRPQGDAIADWVVEATAKLHALVQDKGYKRAFRLWTAAIEPGSESFAVRLFQMDETRGACLAAVQRTRAGEALAVLLGG